MCNKCPTPELSKQHQLKAAQGRHKKSLQKYYENPYICKTCNSIISYENRKNQKLFCSRSCSAKTNNKLKNKISKTCLNCNLYIKSNKKYCDNRCQAGYKYSLFIKEWQLGLRNGVVGIQEFMVSAFIRKYLHKKYNSKCCECGWNKVHSKTGRIPLQVDHIDGDVTNNREENLRLLCPNCHSLTDTFGSLNKGNSRRNKNTFWENS